MKSEDIFSIIGTYDLNKLEQWLAKGFEVNQAAVGTPYWTPLQDAIDELDYNSSTKIVERLLQAGANPNFWDPRSINSPLMMAVLGEHKKIVKLLLKHGADPNISSEGTTPLMWSVQKDDLKMVKLLLKYDLSDIMNKPVGMAGMNPLGMAVSTLNFKMIKQLIKAGANPHIQDIDWKTPIERLPEDVKPEVKQKVQKLLSKFKDEESV